MAKQEVSAQQVQMAAAAGVKLLQVEDLPVPLSVAKSGSLGILDGMLQAIANGEVILAQPPEPENNLGNVGENPIAPVDPSVGVNVAPNENVPNAEANDPA